MNTATVKQPRALYYLFMTEMWERFGFYIVQGLLVLYMTQYFGFTDNQSYTILGVFTALAYISPLVGGYLANKRLGFKLAIRIGGALLILGYILLALPFAKTLLYPALATIIVGNGLFKPNISSLLGAQYHQDDANRDAGFTVFYIGINIGAFLAGLSAGYIKLYFGWQMSFAVAAAGLLVGLATFIFGSKAIIDRPSEEKPTRRFFYLFAPVCILLIVGIAFLLQVDTLAVWLLPCVGIILLGYLLHVTMQQDATYQPRMLLLIILILASIVYWMLFLQLFSSANLYVERAVDKNLFGIPLTTTFFWGSESIFIILLGPLFALLWQSLSKSGRNPSALGKFALGILFAGLGFVVLAISTYYPNAMGQVHALWVFGAYLLITIGELLLSPIGLSAVTTLAPANLVGLMMGVWFVATGFGGIFSGLIAKFASVPANVTQSDAILAIYRQAFMSFAVIAFLVVLVLWAIHFYTHRYFREQLA